VGSGSLAPPLLTSALDGGEWSGSRPCLLTLIEKALGTHCIAPPMVSPPYRGGVV
jgi:hypothetical protein